MDFIFRRYGKMPEEELCELWTLLKIVSSIHRDTPVVVARTHRATNTLEQQNPRQD